MNKTEQVQWKIEKMTNDVLKGDRVFIPTAYLIYVINEIGYECIVQSHKLESGKRGYIVQLKNLIYIDDCFTGESVYPR